MNKKKILITGSCGFIFGNFIRRLVYEKQPYQIIGLDKVNSNSLNSMYWNKSHIFHIANVCDQHTIDVIFQLEKPDIVIHGAESLNEDIIQTNILGTQVMVDACLKHKVEKFIYVSTDKVYGHLTDESSSWTEESSLNPKNAYAVTKISGEQLVKVASQAHGLIYNIVRLANNYGPRQSSEKLIPKIIKSILNNKKIPVYGQGLQMREWIHVADNCDAIMKVIECGKDNETYNISSNQEMHNIELVQKICNTMNAGHNLIDFVSEPNNCDFRRASNNTKIKELGWKPNYKFKDGIVNVIEWNLNNKWNLK